MSGEFDALEQVEGLAELLGHTPRTSSRQGYAQPRQEEPRRSEPRYESRDRGYREQGYNDRGSRDQGYSDRGYRERGYDDGAGRREQRSPQLTEATRERIARKGSSAQVADLDAAMRKLMVIQENTVDRVRSELEVFVDHMANIINEMSARFEVATASLEKASRNLEEHSSFYEGLVRRRTHGSSELPVEANPHFLAEAIQSSAPLDE